MKAIMMSIRPQHVANILNGLKTLEIRKRFPKDYAGWVYIYVTKGKPYLSSNGLGYYIPKKYEKYMGNWNGKVVARFWVDKVEEIENKPFVRYGYPRTKTLDSYNLTKYSCVDNCDIKEYLVGGNGYAIHITKLEIFDKPKELSEFKVWGIDYPTGIIDPLHDCNVYYKKKLKPLTRAPQSYCYVEV